MNTQIVITQTTHVSPRARIWVSVFLMLIAAGGILILTKAIRGIGEARESGSWPTVAGKIIRSEMDVDTVRDDDGDRSSSDSKIYSAKIEYEFEINGVTQRGSRIAALQNMNANKEHVQKILNKYPLDRAVTVSYKPDDPSVCVLEPGSWGGAGVFFGLAAVFTLVPLGFLIAIWRIGKNNATTQSTVIANSTSHSAKTKIGISVVLLIFIGIGCVPLTWAIQGMREAGASRSWPTVPGKITKSYVEVTTTQTRDRDNYNRTSYSYSAEIEYDFKVEGATYRGLRVAVVSDQFGDEAYAKATCEKYPLNKAVTVSYKPGDPSECVLEPGTWGGIGFQLVFAAAFILVPLLILRAVWNPAAMDTDPHRDTKAERSRFGLVFRERFLEWEPGNVVHLHRDHLGIVAVVGGALIAGLVVGLFFGLAPAWYFFSGKGPLFVAQVYVAVSLVIAIVGGVFLWLDSRRRDTLIDWNRGTIRVQVGWSAREYPLDALHELTLHVPKPIRVSKDAGEAEKKSTARLFVSIGRKRYVLLETEFHQDAHHHTQRALANLTEQLANDLKVSWSQS